MAAEPVRFGEGDLVLVVAIDLVGCHYQDGLQVDAFAQRVEEVCGAHHIDRNGLDRLTRSPAHQRLCRKVQHDLRSTVPQHVSDCFAVANIDEMGGNIPRHSGEIIEIGCHVGWKSNPGNRSAEPRQPERRPATFKSGMAGQQDAFAAPELHIHADHCG